MGLTTREHNRPGARVRAVRATLRRAAGFVDRAPLAPRWIAFHLAEPSRARRGDLTAAVLAVRLPSIDETTAVEELLAHEALGLRMLPLTRAERLAHTLERVSLSAGVTAACDAWDLARRGWARSDVWSLDVPLCRRLGTTLLEMARLTPGWPRGDQYPSYDDWTSALRTHGAALYAYGTGDLEDPGLLAEAKTAMHWVADNLEHLWT